MKKLSDFTKGQTFFLNKGKISDYGKSKSSFTQDVIGDVNKIMKAHGDLAIRELQTNLDKDKSNASFNLRQSIKFEGIKRSGGKVTYVFSIADYYKYVDEGRGKRKSNTPGNPPLKDKIYDWLIEKGIGQVKERKSMAFFISRKINRSGTKGNKFFSAVFDKEFTENLSRELSLALKVNVAQQITEK